MENQSSLIAGNFNQALMVVKRFPVSALSSIAFFILCFLRNHKRNFELDLPEIAVLFPVFMSAYVSAGIVNLFMHSKDGKIRFYHHLLAFFIAGGLGLAIYYSQPLWINVNYFNIALVLLLLITPLFLFDTSDEVTWRHITDIIGVFLISVLSGIIFGMLGWVFGWILKNFFRFHKLANNPADIWIMTICLVIPILSLILFPKLRKAYLKFPESKTLYSRSYTFLMNYLLPPFIIFMLIILSHSAVPTNFSWPWPKWFAVCSILIISPLLAGFVFMKSPWKKSATPLTVRILNLGILLLSTLILMLTIEFFTAMDTDGITPTRYAIFFTILWLVVIFIWSIIKRKRVKWISILTSLTVMLFFTSFGPWGMDNISFESQKSRFMGLLNKYKLVENGRLVENYKDKIAFNLREIKYGESILKFLSSTKRLESLEPLFEGHKDNPFKKLRRPGSDALNHVTRAFNPEIINDKFVYAQNIKFYSKTPGSIDISVEGKLYGMFTASYYKNTTFRDAHKKIIAWVDEEYLHTKTPAGTWKVELKQLEEHFKPLSDKDDQGLERFVIEIDDHKLEFIFRIFNLTRGKDTTLLAMNTEYSLIVHKNSS